MPAAYRTASHLTAGPAPEPQAGQIVTWYEEGDNGARPRIYHGRVGTVYYTGEDDERMLEVWCHTRGDWVEVADAEAVIAERPICRQCPRL